MKLALLVVLVACGHKDQAVPEAAVVPHDAAPDAVPCPGTSADCAACGSGDGSACFNVLLAAKSDGAKLLWADRGCTAGDLTSCQSLTSYSIGRGDFENAEAREKAAGAAHFQAQRAKCGGGDERACEDAAIMLDVGQYVAKDVAAARALLEPHCKTGAVRACITLASLALPAADKARFAMRACSLGDAVTCGDLVGLFGDTAFARNQGAFARTTLAARCTAKDADACWVLGGLYVTGKGGAKDRAKGTALVSTACKLDSRHCDTRDRLASGGGFFDAALDDVPKLDLGPLIDEAKGGKPHRP